MKKIFSVFMACMLVFGSICVASVETENYEDFTITDDGEITAYYGEEYVVVPQTIDGIPVVKIGKMVFFDLGITDVYLPEGLTVIGESAFEGCNTISVEIPKETMIIGDRAFANCAELRTIFTSFSEKTVIGKDAFMGTGHLLFYVNCDADADIVSQKIREAKGDRNYEVSVRHVATDYDVQGNVVCGECGFKEQTDAYGLPFADVAYDAWYYDYVHSAYLNNIINGKSETIFDPDAGMTCAEAAKIAASIHSASFGEVLPEANGGLWYQRYVDYCYKYGLIEDYIGFDWEKNITRGQMAYMFSHCDPWDAGMNDVPITDIPDVYDTTPFAYEILSLYNKGIAVGDENMSFYPDSDIKRCEAAAIVSRIINWNMRIELPKG